MKPMNTTTTMLMAMIALTACQQDPYPKDGLIQKSEPPVPREVAKPYGLKVPSVTLLEEGKRSTLPIQAWVPSPYRAKVQVIGLPAGATFDESARLISWTPGFDAGNRPDFASDLSRDYPIEIMLVVEGESSVSVRAEALLVVKNVIRPFTLASNPSSTYVVNEGSELVQKLEVSSLDAPEGPFELTAIGLPSGAVISREPGSQSAFIVRYVPGPTVFRLGVGNPASGKEFRVKFQASAPSVLPGFVAESESIWRVKDSRLVPIVSGPSRLSQGPSVNFTLVVEDPNGEVRPTFRALRDPEFGDLQVEPLASSISPGGSPHALSYSVKWSNIPVDRLGSRYRLEFMGCAFGATGSMNGCQAWPIEVDLTRADWSGASIQRAAWAMGTLPFLKLGVPRDFAIEIRDLDLPIEIPTVTIEPPSLASQVSWHPDTQTLRVLPTVTGVGQFNLVAKTKLGLIRSESFVYEVLPAGWSEVLVLTDSLRDVETRAMMERLPGAAVLNPVFQPLGDRELAFRTTIVAGTRALSDPTIRAELAAASTQVRNVVIATPLAGLLNGPLRVELDSLGLSVRGRFLELLEPGAPPLADWRLWPTAASGLTASMDPVRLAGTLSSESDSPAVFNENMGSSCNPELALKREEITALPMFTAVKCHRSGGGTIVVSGMELGDWRFSPADAGLDNAWVGNWVGL